MILSPRDAGGWMVLRVRSLGAAVRSALQHRYPLEALPIADPDPTPGAEPDLIRWIDQVNVGRHVKRALFMQPVSSRTFIVRVPPNGSFRASLALLPEVWERHRGGVVFSIVVAARGGGPLLRRRWVVDPGANPADRAWKDVVLDLARFAGQHVTLTLATELLPGASGVEAWAVWGAPELLERMPAAFVLRAQRENLRAFGIGGTLRRYWARLATADPGLSVYQSWLKANGYDDIPVGRLRAESARFRYQPTISIITPVYNTDPEWLRACVESVRKQAYPRWELCLCDDGSTDPATRDVLRGLEAVDPRIKVGRLPGNRGIAAATNCALGMATGDLIGLLDHDDELTVDALYEVVKLLQAHPEADLIYSDEDKLDPDGRPSEPFFKPDWSPDYLRSLMYIGHFAVYRRSLVEDIGGFRSECDGAQDYDLALRVTERTDRIFHIPRVLYHWRRIAGSSAATVEAKPWALASARRALTDHVARLGLDAEVEEGVAPTSWRVRYRIADDPLVTIFIPTDGRVVQTARGPRDLLLACVRSVVQRTTYKRYELLIVDNGRLSASARAYLAGIPHRRVRYSYTEPFNFAAKVNFAASYVRGEHLVLLNDDIEVIRGEWLSAMLEFSQQPEVGVVGTKLYYPDGRIQHVGVALGIGGGASHVFEGQPHDHPGQMGSTQVIRNYSAVTGACMMTPRRVFKEVGGFDPIFATDFNDVDYCLRARARGCRVVFTPFAELYHYQGSTFGSRERAVNPRETAALSERWGHVIEADPFYNPNLTRSALDYAPRI